MRASVSPSPAPPSPAPAALPYTMHASWAKLFLRQGKYHLISMERHHLPHPLGRSLSDGVFEGFCPRPWPSWAPTSPAETSPRSLVVLGCRRAAAGAGSSGVGRCHPGLWMLPGRKRALCDFCKKTQHEKAVGVAFCSARPFPSPARRASVGGAPLCRGRDREASAQLRGSCR